MHFGRLALLAASALGALATPLLKTYTNPVKPGVGADPWVLKHGGAYYLATATGNNAVFVTRSDNLAQWPENGPMVYNATGLFGAVWAPELHFLRGRFYIYVAMTTPDGDNTFHRMYVLRGSSAADPTQPFAGGRQERGADPRLAPSVTALSARRCAPPTTTCTAPPLVRRRPQTQAHALDCAEGSSRAAWLGPGLAPHRTRALCCTHPLAVRLGPALPLPAASSNRPKLDPSSCRVCASQRQDTSQCVRIDKIKWQPLNCSTVPMKAKKAVNMILSARAPAPQFR